MIDKLNKIIELLDNKGSEPEYLDIRTPIGEDPKGWYVAVVWMHHDGDIVDLEERGQDLNIILDKVLVQLEQREAYLNTGIPVEELDKYVK
jgi:hypothetical protein